MSEYDEQAEKFMGGASAIKAKLTDSDMSELRYSAKALHRWYEAECGIQTQNSTKILERDANGEPYMCYYKNDGEIARYKSEDLEQKHTKKIKSICERNNLYFWLQTDPRGLPVYISDAAIDSQNYTKAFAIDI